MLTIRLTAPIRLAEDNVLDWSETAEEVIILLAVPTSAQKHEVNYKLKPTHLTVSVQGVSLIQAKLSHAVQPEDSVWQFGEHLIQYAVHS